MDDRRQPGLWNRDPQTGFYEQAAPPAQDAPSGPYQYYQPPPPRATQDKGRSFSERAADSPHVDDSLHHNDSGRPHDEIFATAQAVADSMHSYMIDNPEATSAHLAKTQHINSTDLPGSSQQQPLTIDSDFAPANLRSKAWSPDLVSPRTQKPQPRSTQPKGRQISNASNISAPIRRDSVPDRSPLQNLESWSKEEKRARAQRAESLARERSMIASGDATAMRQGTVGSNKGRVVSDGASRRPQQKEADQTRAQRSYDDSQADSLSGGERFQKASEALKRETSPPVNQNSASHQTEAGANTRKSGHRRTRSIANHPQPYHHAPSVPRDADTADRSQQKVHEGARKMVDITQEPQPYHHAPAAPRDADTADLSSQKIQEDTRKSIDHDNEAQSYGHSPKLPIDAHTADRPRQTAPDQQRMSTDLSRMQGNDYRRRARNTGFTGALAAASAGAGIAGADSAAQRGKAAYERRKSQIQDSSLPDGATAGLGIRENKDSGLDQLHTDRMGRASSKRESKAVKAGSIPDSPQHDQVGDLETNTVGFDDPAERPVDRDDTEQHQGGWDGSAYQAGPQEAQHRFRDMFRHGQSARRSYQVSSKPLEEWRQGSVAKLSVKDLEFEQTIAANAAAASTEDKGAAWWEKGHRRASSTQSKPTANLAKYDGPYEEQANGFQPRLFLRCGPLLRYTGLRREPSAAARSGRPAEKETWRGTVMIVTEDNQSDLSSTPILRLFAQPMDLVPQPPPRQYDSAQGLPPDHEDPIAGQVKLSRTGRALYVRSVHDIEGAVDLSREENPDGLYAAVRPSILGPQTTAGLDGRNSPHVKFQDKSRIKNRDGEKAGRVREVKAIRLHTERGWTFWRFNIEVELGSKQCRVAYRINRGPAMAFWVPAKGESMNIMFHSCNGFSRSANPNEFSGPDPLWRDVLNRHQSRPFHVMVGGGDQIYNDIVADEVPLFREWLHTKNSHHKYEADFSAAMQDELEDFYLERYAMWFSQGLFAMANSQIPMINIWDDHDIIDGFGSYPHDYMSTRVFSGVGAVAYKYYLLFQHQSLITETAHDESSWILGDTPGPYIKEVSHSLFLHLGSKVAFVGLDCRTERTWDEILSQRSYDIIFERCRKEIVKGETNHLIVLVGVPIAYPRLNFLENILTSRAMDPIKALGRTGMLGGFVNKFDGGVEILDDLNDHWTAKYHKAERNWFVQELQELAAEKSVRITILGGDVHLGAVGQFYTPKKHFVSKDQDHRYMPNVISSAIVNTPPPNMLADVLNRRNKVHHLDDETDEDLIPMFSHDVDGSKRNNTRLLPRRNYCTIREYHPGTTPSHTPPPQSQSNFFTPDSVGTDGQADEFNRRFPPGSMTRTMSLTRGTANLVRRLSGSSRLKRPPTALSPAQAKPYGSLGQANQGSLQRANSMGGPRPESAAQERPVQTFHRRPTNLSVREARKAAAKGGATGTLDGREPGHIDLEGGLDISLNVEIDQHDPAGATVPYRILVPALWYDGPADLNPSRFKSHRASLMDRLKSFRKRETPVDDIEGEEDYSDDGSRASTPSPIQRPQASPPPEQSLGLTSTGRGALKRDQNVGRSPGNDYDGISKHDPRSAYNQGYNLSSPPIGTGQPVQAAPTRSASVRQSAQMQAGADGSSSEYQRRGHQRHVSAPVNAQPPRAHDSADDMSDDYDDSDDDDYDDRPVASTQKQAPVRRGSKAERFLGIGAGEATGPGAGEGGVRRTSAQLDRSAIRPSALLGRESSLRRKLGWGGWKS